MKDCNQCGKCCTKYSNGGLSASAEEIAQWEVFNPDIRAHVRDGKIWADPNTGQALSLCPWLRIEDNQRYSCAIYLDRPNDCRYYPMTIEQMRKDDCEMLEVSDLSQPKSAQRALDKLMQDSRPPAG